MNEKDNLFVKGIQVESKETMELLSSFKHPVLLGNSPLDIHLCQENRMGKLAPDFKANWSFSMSSTSPSGWLWWYTPGQWGEG